jgi:hypothetical protein
VEAVESDTQCLPEPNFRPDTPLAVAGGAADTAVLLESAFRQGRIALQVPEASWRKPKAQRLLRTKARFVSTFLSFHLISVGQRYVGANVPANVGCGWIAAISL